MVSIRDLRNTMSLSFVFQRFFLSEPWDRHARLMIWRGLVYLPERVIRVSSIPQMDLVVQPVLQVFALIVFYCLRGQYV